MILLHLLFTFLNTNWSFGAIAEDLSTIHLLHYVQLSSPGEYVLGWTPRKTDILFEVQAKTKGYFGLGFSPNGGMAGSDIVMGWFNQHGIGFLSDRHAVGKETPIEDDSLDYDLIYTAKNDTHITMRFIRKWDTNDTQDYKLSSDTVRVIWAMGDANHTWGQNVIFMRHSRRGTKSTLLTEANLMEIPKGPGIRHIDILYKNFSIQSHKHTVYWCSIHKFPRLQKKNHIIAILPKIDEASDNFVHHIVLRECVDRNQTLDSYSNHPGFECYTPSMPTDWYSCATTLVVWAIGSNGEVFPDHVGFPVGENGEHKYYLMETHYDNPEFKEGIVDYSGMRILYTDQLREFEAGTLVVAHDVSATQIIPKHQNLWTNSAFCTFHCLNKKITSNAIRVFTVLLHMHLLGRKVRVRHFRNNKELPEISRDYHYDFNFQQSRMLQEEIEILPNDSLVLECHYNSSMKNNFTLGGLSTRDEMCEAYLMYYPRQTQSSYCSSSPSYKNLKSSLKFEKYNTDRNENTINSSKIKEVKFKALKEYVKAGNWTSLVNLQELQENILYGEQTQVCYFSNGQKPVMEDFSPSMVLMSTENGQNAELHDSKDVNKYITVTLDVTSSSTYSHYMVFTNTLAIVIHFCIYLCLY